MNKFKILTADIIKRMFEEHSELVHELNGEVTDYASLLGVSTYGSDLVEEKYGVCLINGYNSYTKNLNFRNVFHSPTASSFGVRPTIAFSTIKDKAVQISDESSDTLKYKYGEYPQTIVDKEMQNKLNKLFWNNKLSKTNRYYSFVPHRSKSFDLYSLQEYEVDGKKYVRVPYMEKGILRGDLDMIDYSTSYWVEVEPIVWLVDKKLNLAMSEKVLFSGVPFNDEKLYDSEYYKVVTPVLDQYLDRVFRYEINDSSLVSNEERELDKLIDFTIDRVYELLDGRKTQSGLVEAVDEIVIALVKLANKKNVVRKRTSEEVITEILDRTSITSRDKEVGFMDFENAILVNKSAVKSAKEEAINKIKSKKPSRIGSIHHDDWWEDDDTYYPTCNHLIRRPVEKTYWKRMK